MVLEGMLVGPEASVRNFLQTLGPTKTYSSSPVQHVGLINDLFIIAIILDTSILAKQTNKQANKPFQTLLRTKAKHAQSTEVRGFIEAMLYGTNTGVPPEFWFVFWSQKFHCLNALQT